MSKTVQISSNTSFDTIPKRSVIVAVVNSGKLKYEGDGSAAQSVVRIGLDKNRAGEAKRIKLGGQRND